MIHIRRKYEFYPITGQYPVAILKFTTIQ